MPELPEVEITRRGVEQRFVGQQLLDCSVFQPKLRHMVPVEISRCCGQRLIKLGRRAKYLWMQFEHDVLVIHLGMSGSLRIVAPDTPLEKHDHVQWRFENAWLNYNDPRRFGSVQWVNLLARPNWEQEFGPFSRLGPEPFSADFTPDALFGATRGVTQSIKTLLLAGSAVVGAGNIYACEALFRSGIAPTRKASSLTREEVELLHGALVAVLAEAIDRGGSTLRNFQAVDGKLGHFQLHCAVYGREGEPCVVCASPVLRQTQNQRSTFFCAHCQQ